MNIVEERFMESCKEMQDAFSDVEPVVKRCPVCACDMSTMHYRKTYCSRECQSKASKNTARKRKRHVAAGCSCEWCNSAR